MPQTTLQESTTSESLLIRCPACGMEVSRYTPTCLKCGHPICPTENKKNDTNKTEQTIIIQQETKQSNGTGTAGFVFAIMSLFLSWVPAVGWILWFLGFILSFIGMFKSPRGLAIAGFLISIIGFIILIAFIGALVGVTSFLL